MTHAAESLRQVIEAALLKLTAPGCTCEPGWPVCTACAAIEALEQLGQAEAVAGMLEAGKNEGRGNAMGKAMTADEFECRLAEALFGCREDGSREEILGRVRELVDLERAVVMKGNKQEIMRAFDQFMIRLEDLSTP